MIITIVINIHLNNHTGYLNFYCYIIKVKIYFICILIIL